MIVLCKRWALYLIEECFPYLGCKTEVMLIGHTKWESVKLLEHTWCRIEAGMMVGTNTLCHNLMWSVEWGYGKSL